MKQITLLLVLSLVIVSIWFRSGHMLAGGEDGIILYNPPRSLAISKNVWIDIGIGFSATTFISRAPFLYLASIWYKEGFSIYIFQKLAYFVLISVGTLAFYGIVCELQDGKKKNYWLSFISAFLYLINPFTMSQIFSRGLYAWYFTFALFPLGLFLYIRGLNTRKIIYALFFSLISLIFAQAFANPAFILSFWTMLFIYFFLYVFKRRKKKSDLFFFFSYSFVFFIFWLLINSWWLLTLFFQGSNLYSSTFSTEMNLPSLLGVSAQFPFTTLIRLLQKYYFFSPGIYGPIYSSILFQVISWILPMGIIVGIYYSVKRRINLYYLFLFLVGLFVCLGSNKPFGFIFVWLFKHFGFLQSFRNPYEKFGLVYTMAYVPLLSLGLLEVSKIFSKKIFNKINKYKLFFILIIVLISGIYLWPYWNGRMVTRLDKLNVVEVPDYYAKANEYFSEMQDKPERLFAIPFMSGDGILQDWQYGYNGLDSASYIFNYPVFSNNSAASDLVMAFRKHMTDSSTAFLFSLLRTNYLVYRQDVAGITKNQLPYLIKSYFPPTGYSSGSHLYCKNIEATIYQDKSWVSCTLEDEGNWGSPLYLHLQIEIDKPAYIEVLVSDGNGRHPRWDGRMDPAYSVDVTKEPVVITLPTSFATENYDDVDYTNVKSVDIMAYSKNPQEKPPEMEIFGIQLDNGKEIPVDEFDQLTNIGKLSIYQPKNYNPAPEFGLLSKVNPVNDLDEFFGIGQNSDLNFSNECLLVSNQNLGKNTKSLSSDSQVEVVESNNLSDTRYWIKVRGGGLRYLILSEWFNSNWRIIKDETKETAFGNSLLNDVRLLNKSSIHDEQQHFIVNGYANLWKDDGGSSTYLVVYRPQLLVDIGWKITEYTIILVSIIGGFCLLIHYRKQRK